MSKKVVLVDDHDNRKGTEEKLKAHENGGKLHRAFSIFVFNPDGKFLLQKRADDKYHAADLWTNTCCSHPAPRSEVASLSDLKEQVGLDELAVTPESELSKLTDQEYLKLFAKNKLYQEMGFYCELEEVYQFTYEAEVGNDLKEKEYDHVLFGIYNKEPDPNPKEVSEWKYVSREELENDIDKNSNHYTPWFKQTLEDVIKEAESRGIFS